MRLISQEKEGSIIQQINKNSNLGDNGPTFSKLTLG
jgi:hypothetical protein